MAAGVSDGHRDDAAQDRLARHTLRRRRRHFRRWEARCVADAERLGHRDRRREPARLEGIGGVLSFVLDVQPVEAQVLAEAMRVQQRRHPFAERRPARPAA